MSNYFGIQLAYKDDLAFLTLDYPNEKFNKLSSAVMRSLDQALDELATKAVTVKACVLQSAKDGIFIVGADIDEIRNITDAKAAEQGALQGQAILTKIEQLPFPTICLIHGACMGGGTELALACTYRLATDSSKTKIGLPEVMLGIIPGFGGTQRLPRLIGLQRALPIILTGSALDSNRAYRNALVDKVIPATFAERYAEEFAQEILAGKSALYIRRRKIKGLFPKLLELVGKPLIYSQARKSVLKQTKGFYPAPLRAIDAVREGLSKSLKEGLKIEARYLGEMLSTPISKNLIRIFYMTEAIKKGTGVSGESKSTDPRYSGVLGAGVMGGGIAYLFANHGIETRMKDINNAGIALGLSSSRILFEKQLKRRKINRRELDRKMGHISGTQDYQGFGRCELVVEAIVENMDVKKKVISELAPYLKDSCILASNTSSLSITEMASVYKKPENFVGMHFFNPVHRMPLVEIIRGKKTGDHAVAMVYALSKKLGKQPIVVNDGPGFLVNRLLMPYLNEAGFLLDEGVSVETLDKAMLDFGMPMGPCLLIDEVGVDVAYKVGKIFEQSFAGRIQGSTAVEKLYHDKRLGKKGGLGFYKHSGEKREVDKTIYGIIQPKTNSGVSVSEMVERMTYSMVNEAAMCLAEGIAFKPEDVEIGMIFGTGFPPFRGGLLNYADDEGLKKIVIRLEEFTSRYGKRFVPCDFLKNMANRNEKFIKP